MSVLRVILLDLLVCFHVLGGAILFRRIFPRESPWFGFLVPTLALLFLLNFIEHFIALPVLVWLLPFSAGGLLWSMLRPGYSWEGLKLPSVLFVIAFTYCLIIRCLHPEIPCWTEGLSDLNRVLDFCLGDTLPPTDSWLPPYDHGGYYNFQHYGASVLKRLFSVDIGTGYNLGYVFLDALTCFMAAAVAFSLTGKKWIAAAVMFAVIVSFTGSAIIMQFFGPVGTDIFLSIDLHHGWCDEHHNPLWHLLDADPYKQRTRLFGPGHLIYIPEFHANLAGYFLTLTSLFLTGEVFKETRANWPWILLVVLPILSVIAATFFLPVVLFFCVGALALALISSRRPENLRFVIIASIVAISLISPTVVWFTGACDAPSMHWTTKEEHTYPWLFAEQWWPVYVPWIFLCFAWRRMSLAGRWLHAAVPLLLIILEFLTISDRELTLEKMWSAIYGAGLVAFLSLLFMQRAWPLRLVTLLMLFVTVSSLITWLAETGKGIDMANSCFRLQGDMILHGDPQKQRLLQVAQRLHGATILSGTPAWGYSQTPALASFSENRSFVGWSYPERVAGNGDEPLRRDNLAGDFYQCKVPDPLSFLNNYNIAAVLIWPDDHISDAILAQIKAQLNPAYYYVDCKMDGPNNAGLFLRLPVPHPQALAPHS